MSLLRYDPFTSAFDNGFDLTPSFRNEQSMSRGWQPSGMTTREDDEKYVFQVDLPGVNKDDLKMKLEDTHHGHTVIHLSGGRQFQSKDGTSFETSSFERHLSLGPNVDKEKTAADLKDGVLTITVPKKEPEPEKPSPTYIPITSGAAAASE
jgi:HSP20 family protein